jgi:outer membrane biosynthesis protein TonB
MKRCPQCEFIYEDDQSLCDMDGVLLVYDPRTLPNFHALATVPALPGATVRRNRMVPAFATILLTLIIASFYYFATPSRVAPPENFAPANVTVPTPEVKQVQPPAEPAATPKPEEVQPAPPPKPPAEPARKATIKPVAVKPAEPKKKDDSKVGSILKKTGKILKKPFKF